jgi:hypothetical protein
VNVQGRERYQSLARPTFCDHCGTTFLLPVFRNTHRGDSLGGERLSKQGGLRVLSEHANGWIWTGPAREYTPQLVTFVEWHALFAEASKVADQAGPEWDWADLE